MAEPFNPLESSKKLRDAGCDQALAEEMPNQINGAISGNVATKSDIGLVQADIELVRAEIELVRKDIEPLATREELKDHMNSQLKWIIGLFVAGFGLLFTALKFFG